MISERTSLEYVSQQFSEWRKNKSYPREAIPDSLWKQTIQLQEQYPLQKICSELKISYESLRKKEQEFSHQICTDDFLRLPPEVKKEEVICITSEKGVKIEIPSSCLDSGDLLYLISDLIS